MSAEQTPLTEQEAQIAEQMDRATQELSSYIQFLCDKYDAEFIVQKVIFTFMPKQNHLPYPDLIQAEVSEVKED